MYFVEIVKTVWSRVFFLWFHPILTISSNFNLIPTIFKFFKRFNTLNIYWLVKSYDFTSQNAILTSLVETLPVPPIGCLVLSKVWSRSYNLTHQWSQINTFAFGNHTTHHHTYFKNTHVHIQAFHILQSHNAIIIIIEPILICKSVAENR